MCVASVTDVAWQSYDELYNKKMARKIGASESSDQSVHHGKIDELHGRRRGKNEEIGY
jgi:hypothetical protein